jgi:hypothetical protein
MLIASLTDRFSLYVRKLNELLRRAKVVSDKIPYIVCTLHHQI